jgi:uncharacterized OsmC-like protein
MKKLPAVDVNQWRQVRILEPTVRGKLIMNKAEAMKWGLCAISAPMIFSMAGCSANIEDKNTPYLDYHVQTRVEKSPEFTTFRPENPNSPDGSVNENVTVVVERVLNKDSFMLKKGTVQPMGGSGLSSWQLLSDEGGINYEQSAPNPLTYLTTGITSNLLTQVNRSAEILGLNIDSMKVEVKVFFRFDDVMSEKWAGYTDKVIANILIESKESPEKILEMKRIALNGWVAGEALTNKTEIETDLVINGNHWDGKGSRNGGVPNPVSIDNNLTLTSKSSVPKPATFEVGEDVGISPKIIFNPQIKFAVVAVAEPVKNEERPYLQKIKVRAIQDNYSTWDLYADDSYGYGGLDKAPTSLDYLTAGISLCLMSQLDINQSFFWAIHRRFSGISIDDYRIESQINYRQENFMTSKMKGYADKVITKVVVKSKASEKDLNTFFNQSLRMCFAGEAFKNETEIASNLYLNGNLVE